jgi:hypothetical protein
VFPVKYELGIYIPGDWILHSERSFKIMIMRMFATLDKAKPT